MTNRQYDSRVAVVETDPFERQAKEISVCQMQTIHYRDLLWRSEQPVCQGTGVGPMLDLAKLTYCQSAPG
ncbi:hypothetical protein [Parasphingorhabdus sp.]|uniref:hypothetical protein n=1 Tax=Parasphingorhabdus sp. TaxID=2709688 RepID=UPI0032EFA57B